MGKINERIEELTSDILKQNDLFKIPADILVIAKNCNIDVFNSRLISSDILGAIRYEKTAEKFQIVLNDNIAGEEKVKLRKKRFVLAHELGHFFLHKEALKSAEIHIDVLYKKITQEDEKEVDYFAGALLMNKLLLEKTFETVTDTQELADLFEVTETDMTVRLTTLGLI